MIDVLVRSFTLVSATVQGDIGRFFHVEPFPGTVLRPGMVARFSAPPKKGVITGKVVEFPGGGLVVDTFE